MAGITPGSLQSQCEIAFPDGGMGLAGAAAAAAAAAAAGGNNAAAAAAAAGDPLFLRASRVERA